MNHNIIVFDTETTGFSPEQNEIVQLSYILYNTDTQSVLYATRLGSDLVNINGKIPKDTSDVHGITKEMTLDKRPIKEHIDEFITYCIQASKFVGHNVKFDIKMITGQIKKVIAEHPEEAATYEDFLKKFAMVDIETVDKKSKKKTSQVLPDTAFCTMTESKGVCAQLKGVQNLKNEKLMEVHKLLFGQDVGGQLHNALVDISVTLRVYLKLTMDIDICQSIDKLASSVPTLTNNNEICNLINPIPIIQTEVKNVDYSGELITGIDSTPEGLVENTVINVETIAKKMATDLVSTTISVCTKKLNTEDEKCQIKKLSRGFVSRFMSSLPSFTKKSTKPPTNKRTKKRNRVAPGPFIPIGLKGGSRKKRARSVKKKEN
jgi:DNA polymerase III epsilon subunit-like protein